ncbi:YgcG family protein [Sphingosinicella sp. BN140058]|uniref:TPM domain-containing protein n=1 Tax=Sphingosinicella sp. BN140058 TaxID=1892855 RepID=UPI0010112D8C|nr:TPM domain-containing protein [Sphingosinicella sp. BN140058]QAY76801.1 methanol dehydrogenase [Sphingosinicella sp. BN140058]
MARILTFAFALLIAAPALAQTVPALTGRVVDQAGLLDPAEEQALSAKLEALQRTTSRQLVVVTMPDLQGYPIEDVGFKLGETWKLGDKEADNGALLLVAVAERKIRIEVGDGLEPILTDAFSGRVIRNVIRPHFQQGDYPGGITAGADALIAQMQAPPEQAERAAIEAQQQQQSSTASGGSGGGSILTMLFWGFILLFVILPMFRGGKRGRRHRRGGGVFVWGPGLGGGGWGGGGSSWGGGGSSWGGGGGFSGGGGSFGGGGASGDW